MANTIESESIFQAIKTGQLNSVKKLIESGVDLNDEKHFSLPLVEAVYNLHLGILQLLLKNGASPLLNNKSGKNAIDALQEIKNKTDSELFDKAKTLLNNASHSFLEKNQGIQSASNGLADEKLARKIQIEDFVGQENAKSAIKEIVALANLNKLRISQGMPALQLSFHAVFQGPPGTGKTTFARYYAEQVKELGMLTKGHLVEVSRNDLVAGYSGQTAIKTQKLLDEALGGILFIDEAYALKHGDDDDFGQECIDTILKYMEDKRSQLIVIFAGYEDEMRTLIDSNPGLKSRVSNYVTFADFSDAELEHILDNFAETAHMQIEPNAKLIAVGEIQKEKKGKAFGNARTVRNVFEEALKKQSIRISENLTSEINLDLLKTLKAQDFDDKILDVNVEKKSQGLAVSNMGKLESMVGLGSVKNELKSLVDLITVTKLRNQGKGISNITLHMVFNGNPGTGKTAIARLVGSIIQELGVLSSGHVVEVDRSELVAGYTGQTAIKTQAKIDEALGGILFIDEAYSLQQGDNDQFGIEAINTILKAAEDHRDKLVIILAGYKNEMNNFMNSNPGLKSRFTRDLEFKDYTDDELAAIAIGMVRDSNYHASSDVIEKIKQVVNNLRKSESHFGNARALRNILENAYRNQATRLVASGINSTSSIESLNTLLVEDVDG